MQTGEIAKQIFEKARLPNEILGKIWNLADTEQRGALSLPEFIIAMHLLASFRSRSMTAIPATLPPGLYEAAARRGQATGRNLSGQWPGDIVGIPRQLTGSAASPDGSPGFNSPAQSLQTGDGWAIDKSEREKYYAYFSKLDVQNRGHISGEQAVLFFSDSRLSEEVLASIWDLADVNSDGQLNQAEFAVAMHLIRQQRTKGAPPLPATLPLNLIPPSMRNESRPSIQANSSPPDSLIFPVQAGKSAADDLFGLDTLSTPAAVQQSQSTGGSLSQNKPMTDPFSNSSATSPTASQTLQPPAVSQSSTFKPFTPTSSFGQNLAGSAGLSGSSSSLNQSRGGVTLAASDDLLGDNDPEVSKKLTQETTELANMSNQITTLRTQMEDVQLKKGGAETELSTTNAQRRDLEARLLQIRGQYEQEAKAVNELQQKLIASRNATKKLQQEFAMVEGTHQDLQNQHRQVAAALEADEHENALLKERIRHSNQEVSRLRPLVEKMRSEARQQKGLVAINKKQLATNEAEKDKLRSELDSKTPEQQEKPEINQSSRGEVAVESSPAASLTRESTNPFFRKSTQPLGETTPATPNNFDNIFASPFPQQTTGGPPPTSFRSDSNNAPSSSMPSGRSVQSSEPDVPTPSTTPPLSSYHGSPRVVEPPAPPASRQITSSALPLRGLLSRNESVTSSVKVSTPSSRYSAGAETPTNVRPDQTRDSAFSEFSSAGKGKERRMTDSSESTEYGDAEPTNVQSSSHEQLPEGRNIPLERKGTEASVFSNKSESSSTLSQSKADSKGGFFEPGGGIQGSGAGDSKSDFDAAFAGFSNRTNETHNTVLPANTSVFAVTGDKAKNEFPPIQDLTRDEDSDSESDHGFDDNFTPNSPKGKGTDSSQGQVAGATSNIGDGGLLKSQPSDLQIEQFRSVPGTPLPPANAQASPPTYQQTVKDNNEEVKDSSHFPQEYAGLLPAREDPTTGEDQQTQASDRQAGAPTAGESQGEALFGSQNTSKSMTVGTSSQGPAAGSSGLSGTPVSTGTSEAYDSAVSQPSSTDKMSVPAMNPASASVPIQTTQPTQAVSSSSEQQLQEQPAIPSNVDDFDDGFDDLADAKEADEKDEDDPVLGSSARGGFDDFGSVFESSSTSRPNLSTSSSQRQAPHGKAVVGAGAIADGSFSDFEHVSRDAGSMGMSQFGQAQDQTQLQSSTSTTHDWDAMFSGLDAPVGSSTGTGTLQTGPLDFSGGAGGAGTGGTGDAFGSSTATNAPLAGPAAPSNAYAAAGTPMASSVAGPSSQQQGQASSPPPLQRGISIGTEHDDPILKKLTSMGYAREDALAALERFDYDINKVCRLSDWSY